MRVRWSFRRLLRRAAKGLVLVALAALAAIASAAVLIGNRAEGRIFTEAALVPERQVVIVPGARIFASGAPSLTVQDRLDGAEALFERGTVGHVLVSGDNRTTSYNEPAAMRNALVDAGLPASAVSLDYAGLDTWDTCIRAKEQFGVDDAVIVTQRRYAKRAVALCRAAGIDVVALAVEPPAFQRGIAKVLRSMRESLATVKAAADIIRTPPAQHGGPMIGLVGSEGMPPGGHPPDWDWTRNAPAT